MQAAIEKVVGDTPELASGARCAKHSSYGRHLFLEDRQSGGCPPVQNHPQSHEIQGVIPKDDICNFSN
jgi:hypothetical protein